VFWSAILVVATTAVNDEAAMVTTIIFYAGFIPFPIAIVFLARACLLNPDFRYMILMFCAGIYTTRVIFALTSIRTEEEGLMIDKKFERAVDVEACGATCLLRCVPISKLISSAQLALRDTLTSRASRRTR
jgi:hypothetical protein